MIRSIQASIVGVCIALAAIFLLTGAPPFGASASHDPGATAVDI